jgi:hypothetical protein
MRPFVVLTLVLSACGPKPVQVEPTGPRTIILMPDVPDHDRLCVVLTNPPYERDVAGVHCLGVGALRQFLGRLRTAND